MITAVLENGVKVIQLTDGKLYAVNNNGTSVSSLREQPLLLQVIAEKLQLVNGDEQVDASPTGVPYHMVGYGIHCPQYGLIPVITSVKRV